MQIYSKHEILNNEIYDIKINQNGNYYFSIYNLNALLNFDVKKNIFGNIFLIIFPGDKIINQDVAKLKAKFILNENSKLKFYLANLTNQNIDDNYEFKLNGKKSEINYYSACLLKNKIINNTNIKINHVGIQTLSNVKAFYVLKNLSCGFVRCISELSKGCAGSNAAQELRLTILDVGAKANSDPVLLINENDISASHANAIGMLDLEQIFYMQSRGLKKRESEQLIIKGYFTEILECIDDNQISLKNNINKILDGEIYDN